MVLELWTLSPQAVPGAGGVYGWYSLCLHRREYGFGARRERKEEEVLRARGGQTLVSAFLSFNGFPKIAISCQFLSFICKKEEVASAFYSCWLRWMFVCGCICTSSFWEDFVFDKTGEWHLLSLLSWVLWSGQNVLSHDIWVCGPSTGSIAGVSQFLKKQEQSSRTIVTRLPFFLFFVMDASLSVVGLRARQREGGTRHKWTPETSCEGRGVASVCFGHGLCQCI